MERLSHSVTKLKSYASAICFFVIICKVQFSHEVTQVWLLALSDIASQLLCHSVKFLVGVQQASLAADVTHLRFRCCTS